VRRAHAAIGPCLLLTLAGGCAGTHTAHGDDATMHHRFDDVEHWVKVFDDPGRNEWQKPAEVLRFLALHAGSRVADLGAGTGYFTIPLAHAVGERGKVYAIDVEPGLVEHLRHRSEAEGVASVVEPVLAAPDDPGLTKGSVDLILVCDTWHHIDARLRYLDKLDASLAPEGRLAILDFREGELPVGPPAAHKLSRQQVIDELTQAGWRLKAEFAELPYQYLLVFAPPE